jgi:hypothetical protein
MLQLGNGFANDTENAGISPRLSIGTHGQQPGQGTQFQLPLRGTGTRIHPTFSGNQTFFTTTLVRIDLR